MIGSGLEGRKLVVKSNATSMSDSQPIEAQDAAEKAEKP
jgi:hypothetical protein